MPDLGKAYVQIVPSAEGIQGKITKALGGEVSEAGSIAQKVLGSKLSLGALTAGAAVAKAGKAIYDFTADAVQAGMDFDSSMSQVAATMGVTEDQIGELRDFAQEMGSSTAFSATEAADALNYMALAGYDAKTSMDMLPNVLNLAAAGDIQLARASDMVTDAQSALGLSLDDTNVLVDQMARTSSKSNTSVEQLGDAILTIGATARSVKGGTAELSTVLGVLADNGIKGAEGGTHLRNILLSLQTPTKDGAEALAKLGMSYADMYDEAGNMRAIPELMLELQSGMKGMTQASKDAIISGIFNKTDLASVNALIGTSAERFDELAESIEHSQGAAQAMADTQLDNLAGDITLWESAVEGLQIAVADKLNPALRFFVELGTDVVGGLTEIIDGFDNGVPSVDELTRSTQAFYDTVETGKANLDDTSTSIEATAMMADRYITALEGMGDTAGMTAAEHQQYHNYLVLLTQAIPELAGVIDLETDAIDGGTDALRENVEAWEARERAKAGKEYLSEVYQAQADVLLEQAKNSVELTRAEDELSAAQTRRAEILEEISALQDELKAGTYEGGWDQYDAAITALDAELRELDGTIPDLIATQDALSQSAEENAQAVADAEAEIALAQDTVAEYSRMLGDTSGAAEAAADGIDAVTGAAAGADAALDDAGTALNEASQALAAIGTAAEEAMEGGGDLRAVYDDLSAQAAALEGDLDAETLAMVDQQLAALNLAATNQELTASYPQLVGMLEGSVYGSLSGLSSWLIQNGIDAATWGQQVTSATGSVVNGFSELDTSLDMSLDEMAANMQSNIEAYTSWEANIAELMAAAVESGDAGQIAFVQYMQEMGIGAAEQVAAMAEDVEGTMETFGPLFSSAVDAAMTEVQQSIEGANLGDAVQDAVSGVDLSAPVETALGGMDDAISGHDLTGAVDALVSSAADAAGAVDFTGSGLEISEEVAAGIESGAGEVSGSAQILAASADSPLAAEAGNTYTWGYHMGVNFASGIADTAGFVSAAAASVAAAAAAQLQHTTPKEGPLMHDDEWGYHMMDNFIEGITGSEDRLRGALQTTLDFGTMSTVMPQTVSAGDMSAAQIADLLREYLPAILSRPVALDDGAIIGRYMPVIDAGLGQRTGYAERGHAM